MKTTLSVLCLIAICLTAARGRAEDAVTVRVEPETIHMGATYNGTTLMVDGTVPSGSDVVIRLMGSDRTLHMKEKGKALGLLWMNLGSITIKGAPSVCMVSTSGDLSGTTGSKGESSQAGSLLLNGLQQRVSLESGEANGEMNPFQEFLKLKRSEGLYTETEGNVTCRPGSKGTDDFRVEIPVPSRFPPGDYSVQVYALKDGNIVAQKEQRIHASLVGTPEFLAKLAFGNGAMYGVLATLVALLGGLAIGMVFQSKGSH